MTAKETVAYAPGQATVFQAQQPFDSICERAEYRLGWVRSKNAKIYKIYLCFALFVFHFLWLLEHSYMNFPTHTPKQFNHTHWITLANCSQGQPQSNRRQCKGLCWCWWWTDERKFLLAKDNHSYVSAGNKGNPNRRYFSDSDQCTFSLINNESYSKMIGSLYP